MTTLDPRAQAIWDAVEARIDAAPIDGISAEGQYSETVFNGQRLYVDGLRAGRLAAINALSSIPEQPVGVNTLVDRFLRWKLPENFNPDGGISFEPYGNPGTPQEYRRSPSGTNLFDAPQAEAMIRHILGTEPTVHQHPGNQPSAALDHLVQTAAVAFDAILAPFHPAAAGEEVTTHLAWLRSYTSNMTADNWLDMRLHIDRQVDRLEAALCTHPAAVAVTDEMVEHPDDLAVDRFAAAMKAKLAQKRAEGRGGWQDKSQCAAEFLSKLLREHIEKGDPLDVGNLAMMLHQRGERIASPGKIASWTERERDARLGLGR
jgi:hypothetical protein